MAWRLFRWGSRGEYYETDFPGIYTMAHIFIPDAIKVTLQGSGGYNQELINTIGVKVPGGATPSYADCLAVAGVVKNWWEVTYKHFVAADVGISQIVATSQASAPAPQAQLTSTAVGDRPGTPAMDAISLCVKLGTNLTGRRHRGRFYSWPPVTADLATPDVFTAAYVNAMQLALGDLGTRIQTAGYIWAILSPTDATAYPIVRAVATDLLVDSQNRRKANHGR